MQETLEDFFRALRAADIQVSPAEAIDAHRAVDGDDDVAERRDRVLVERQEAQPHLQPLRPLLTVIFTKSSVRVMVSFLLGPEM